MKTILQIRVNSDHEDLEEYIRALKKDFPKFTNNKKLESLILRNADDKIYEDLSNLNFTILKDDCELINKYKKIIDKPFYHFFVSINFDLSDKYPHIFLNFTIQSILERLILILNLSYNFSIDFLEGITFDEKNEVLNTSDSIISDLIFAYEHSEKIKWPNLDKLDINDVIESFNFNNYSLEGISKNDFQRAINSFSHNFFNLFDKSTDILFWNMVGIEALLAKGNKDIQSQIKEKSSLILGEPTEFKKKLTRLYEYRSKFIHGELNFPPKFSSDYESFDNDYFDYMSFSSSILLSLIRNMIKNKKYKFDFEYRLLPQ